VGEILATTDGGRVWHTQLRRPRMISSVDFVNPRDGYAFLAPPPGTYTMGGAEGTLFATIDGGGAWTVRQAGGVHPWEGGRYPENGFQRPPVFYNAVGSPSDPSAFLVTRDGGLRWTVVGQVPLTLGAAPVVSFANPRDAWVMPGLYDGRIWVTHDGGLTWRRGPELPGNLYPQSITLVSPITP
jgi:photosystem II stability/assembly factor-like uncharacterized protein